MRFSRRPHTATVTATAIEATIHNLVLVLRSFVPFWLISLSLNWSSCIAVKSCFAPTSGLLRFCLNYCIFVMISANWMIAEQEARNYSCCMEIPCLYAYMFVHNATGM